MDIRTSMVYFQETNPFFGKNPILPKKWLIISGCVGKGFYKSYMSYISYFSFGTAPAPQKNP